MKRSTAAAPYLAKGTPVALKIQSPDIVHKSEVGGVRLDLGNENAVREAATDILQTRAGGQARRAHHRRNRLSHDRSPEGT